MNLSPVTVRPVQLADVEALNRVCWPDATFQQVQLRVESILTRRERDQAWAAVALVENEVIGYGQLGRWGRGAEISDLMVGKRWRGNGVGTTIIRYLLEKARTQGIVEVEIGAAISNPRALALYRRLGFVDRRQVLMELGSGPEPVIYLGMLLV